MERLAGAPLNASEGRTRSGGRCAADENLAVCSSVQYGPRMAPLRVVPSLESRLATLAQAARHDLSCACGDSEPRRRGAGGLWIYPAALASGQRVPMLKVLQAAGCERGRCYR